MVFMVEMIIILEFMFPIGSRKTVKFGPLVEGQLVYVSHRE